MARKRWYMGVDLGQASDPTAIGIIERAFPNRPKWHDLQIMPPEEYHLRHLERVPLGTEYPRIVTKVAILMRRLGSDSELVVDGTGVGQPVVDMFLDAGLALVSVIIDFGQVGEEKQHKSKKLLSPEKKKLLEEWTVPKKTLVFGLQAMMNRRQFKIAPYLRERDVLKKEIENFRVKVKTSAKTGVVNESYSAREGQHDDLVLATAIAIWRATLPVRKVGVRPGNLLAR